MPRKKSGADAITDELRKFGLGYPQAHTKSPWPGHLDLAVKDKTFAYLSAPGEPFSMSCKLPESNVAALSLPFVEPTGYGLGKSGWVTAKFEGDRVPPLDVLKAWIDESYRAVAPKKLVAELSGGAAAKQGAAKQSPAKQSPMKRSPAKQSPAKQSPAKQSPAKQSSAKQSPAKQSSAKQSSAKQSPTKQSQAKQPPARKKAAAKRTR